MNILSSTCCSCFNDATMERCREKNSISNKLHRSWCWAAVRLNFRDFSYFLGFLSSLQIVTIDVWEKNIYYEKWGRILLKVSTFYDSIFSPALPTILSLFLVHFQFSFHAAHNSTPDGNIECWTYLDSFEFFIHLVLIRTIFELFSSPIEFKYDITMTASVEVARKRCFFMYIFFGKSQTHSTRLT